MEILQTTQFKKVAKKLHGNQKQALDEAVRAIIDDPMIGEMKIGDLAGVRVHKFKMVGQLTLLAYIWQDEILTLTLLTLGTHENFYRELK